MLNPLEFWTKSIEALFHKSPNAFVPSVSEYFQSPIKEFTIKQEGTELNCEAITIFVEGKWIDLNEFVERYRNIRHVLHNLL